MLLHTSILQQKYQNEQQIHQDPINNFGKKHTNTLTWNVHENQ